MQIKNPQLIRGIVIGVVMTIVFSYLWNHLFRGLWYQFNYQIIHRTTYLQQQEKAYQDCLGRTDRIFKEIHQGADLNTLAPSDKQIYEKDKKDNEQVCNRTYKK